MDQSEAEVPSPEGQSEATQVILEEVRKACSKRGSVVKEEGMISTGTEETIYRAW